MKTFRGRSDSRANNSDYELYVPGCPNTGP